MNLLKKKKKKEIRSEKEFENARTKTIILILWNVAGPISFFNFFRPSSSSF